MVIAGGFKARACDACNRVHLDAIDDAGNLILMFQMTAAEAANFAGNILAAATVIVDREGAAIVPDANAPTTERRQ